MENEAFVQEFVIFLACVISIGPIFLCFVAGNQQGIFKQLLPNVSLVAHEVAYNKRKHKDPLNKLVHICTNPLIILSLFCILDNTEIFLDSPYQKFLTLNGAGIYFLVLATYYFYIETSIVRASTVNIILFGIYCLRVPLQNMMGEGSLIRYLLLYISSHLIQIFFGHYLAEGGYDFNFNQLFITQQYIFIVLVLFQIGFFTDFDDEVNQIAPIYEKFPSLQPKSKYADTPKLVILKALHLLNLYIMPHYSRFNVELLSFSPILQNIAAFPGIMQLIIHRAILNQKNLLKCPQTPAINSLSMKQAHPSTSTSTSIFRPDYGFNTDTETPTASATGYAIGRNMAAIPKHLRNPMGVPDIQIVAQRLLARGSFVPAGNQLNIIAAAWVQAQVHGWMNHFEEDEAKVMSNGQGLCPMKKFKVHPTLERPDGHYDSEISQWWDASFVYGQTKADLNEIRLFSGGKLKLDEHTPGALPLQEDETYSIGHNKNSWVGISLLQELFLKEHNWICDQLAKRYPCLEDDDLFGFARNIIAALNAKIHTIDWTVELLKTKQIEIALNTNWNGVTKAIFGKKAPGHPFRQILKKKADNKGVPFSLTEEFIAMYRLHPLCPPGIVIDNDSEFIPFEKLINEDGRKTMKRSSDMPHKIMKSMYSYPCGKMVGANYPHALRQIEPTDEFGNGRGFKMDLAVVDLYRDRERGIPLYQDFRRNLHMKPWKSWKEMTGDDETAKKLELVYGPAPGGIEKCDLLVGNLYEKKLEGFAISETSFIIFMVMASRRLDADPFLNEFFDDVHYTEFGLEHIDNTDGLRDLLKRHYPDIAAPFIKRNQSAFKPLFGAEKWAEVIEKGIVEPSLVQMWRDTKNDNANFFKELEKVQTSSSNCPFRIEHQMKNSEHQMENSELQNLLQSPIV